MSDLVIGLLGGVGGALAGFAMTAIWEAYRHRRDMSERELGLVRACLMELGVTQHALETNAAIVEHEIGILAADRRSLTPLEPLDTSALDLLFLAQPAVLRAEDVAALLAVRGATRTVQEAARGREGWRLHGVAMTGFSKELRAHDEIVLRSCRAALAGLAATTPTLEQARRRLEYRLRFERYFEEAGTS